MSRRPLVRVMPVIIRTSRAKVGRSFWKLDHGEMRVFGERNKVHLSAYLHNDIVLADSADVVTRGLVERIVDEEIAKLPGVPDDYVQARATFVDVAIADDFAEFLTLPAYERMP